MLLVNVTTSIFNSHNGMNLVITTGSVAGLTAAEVWDYAGTELAAAPTVTSSMKDKIAAVFQYLFGKRIVSSNTETLYKDDGSSILGTAGIVAEDATTTKGKVV